MSRITWRYAPMTGDEAEGQIGEPLSHIEIKIDGPVPSYINVSHVKGVKHTAYADDGGCITDVAIWCVQSGQSHVYRLEADRVVCDRWYCLNHNVASYYTWVRDGGWSGYEAPAIMPNETTITRAMP